ncbi:MAG: hypothetical protein OSB00_11940 [Sphingomonas bacterium]|nr:hypothetical protein [Sphingomonas bacterium]
MSTNDCFQKRRYLVIRTQRINFAITPSIVGYLPLRWDAFVEIWPLADCYPRWTLNMIDDGISTIDRVRAGATRGISTGCLA